MATRRAVWLLVAATAVAAALCYLQASRYNQQRLEASFSRTAVLALEQVDARVRSYEFGSRGVRGAVAAAGGVSISRRDFLHYMQTRNLPVEFPGALGFGFIRRVRPAELALFLAQARADGYPGFAVRELGPHSGDHYIIQYIEPLAPNAAAVGVDIASEARRRSAAVQAARSGRATMTAPVTLAQASGQLRQGFLLLVPVYEPGRNPGTTAEREASLIGWSYAPLLIENVLAGLGPSADDFSLTIGDPAATDAIGPFYESRRETTPGSPTVKLELDMYERRWELQFTASRDYIHRLGLVSPWIPTGLVVGLGLLSALLLQIYLRSGRIERRSLADRARLVAILSDSQDGIIGLTPDVTISDLNSSARQLLGLGPDQGLGQDIFALFPLAEDEVAVAGDLAAVRAGAPVPAREVRVFPTPESPVRVILNLSPLRDGANDITGFAMTLRDVSRQREIEAAFRAISELTGAFTGGAFLQRATSALGVLLRARLVYIARLGAASPGQVEVLAGWQDGETLLPWHFSLDGTADSRLHTGRERPDASRLVDGDAVVLSGDDPGFLPPRPDLSFGAFVGFPLRDSAGRRFGHVAVFHDAALSAPEQARQVEVTRLFSQRIEAEMLRVEAEHERDLAEDRLRSLNLSLESQVEQRTTELRHTSILQHAIVHGAGVAVITTDANGVITLFNPAAETLLGRRAADLVGKQTPAVFHDPDEIVKRAAELGRELGRPFDPGFEVFVHGAEPGITTSREWTYVHANGERIPILLGIAALRDSDGATLGYLGIGVDMRERRQAEQALRDNEEKLRRLFELSPLGIVLSDIDGRMVEVNAAYRHIVGVGNEDVSDLAPLDLAPPRGLEDAVSPLLELEATGYFGPYETEFLHASGRRIPVRLNGVQLLLAGKRFIWSIVEDITSQRQQSDALRSAVQRAESATRAKSDFLANMSHEIRTPMNAVLGMMQLLMRTPLDRRQQEYVHRSQGAATSLLSILNDILDYSKVEAGMLALDSRPFAPESMFQDLSVFAEALAVTPGVEVLFDIDPALPRLLFGDDLRLKQVLINLLGNAIKFTAAGEIVLSARQVAKGAASTQVRFSVRDSGIGVARENQARIFEGFAQAETNTSRRFGGTGLGLAICTQLVGLMQSRIELDSQPGVGSDFSFTVALGNVAEEPSHVLPIAALGHRVLAVDDNATSLALLAAQCRELGCQVDTAATGEEALALAEHAHFDVALVDWRLPGIDGVEVLQRLDSLPADRRPRALVLVTAADRRAVQDRLANQHLAGVSCLFKPLLRGRLLEALATEAGDPAGGAAMMVLRSNDARLAGLRVLVVEDNLVNQKVAQDLLEAEGAAVRLSSGGLQALALLRDQPGWPQVILMDVQMPDCDGYEATRRIRGELAMTEVPIIAITANVSALDRARCLASGMNDHVGKPFDLDRLCEVILASVDPVVAGSASQEGDAGQDPMTVEYGGAAALKRFGGRKDLLARALRGYADEVPVLLAVAGDLAAHPADRARALHSLKGLAATVGAGQLASLASDAEVAARGGGDAPEPEAFESIQRAARQALRWAADLADELDPRVTTATRPPEPAAVRSSLLERLQPLLESSNMAALAATEQVVASWGVPIPEPLELLRRHVERFDFGAALAVCRDLLARTQKREP